MKPPADDHRTKAQLLEALWAAETTNEEGGEIIAEMAGALAVLCGERLTPCVKGCEGHFGPATERAVKAARDAWNALQDGNAVALARIAELEARLTRVQLALDGAAVAT